MSLSAILNDRPTVGYRMLPEGSRIDPMFDHLEQMRRHENMGTYRLTVFANDITKQVDGKHLVTGLNLPLHLRSICAGESKALGTKLSLERVREMILELPFTKEQLLEMDPAVALNLGLMAAAR